ncbi:MAG: beta-glucosidase [Phycisphaeraceae bacterium]|nr:MAG: beta-glucosidase [Phycisphaeraceae bacterium]
MSHSDPRATSFFPPGFVWGAASSAYQIEGAHDADGKGPSVWDAFCDTPGKVFRGHTGRRACDHYHRAPSDVAIMKALRLEAYRFSISWPRVIPAGDGPVNPKGLAFYDRLVDTLLDAGITPWVTLFHWDYPKALADRGGWLSPDSPRWFEDYARVIVDALSDRVSHWITINEPQIFIGMGHRDGTHAPGLTLPTRDWLLAGHHALLAHGLASRVIRERAKSPPSVGWAPCGRVDYPADNTPACIDAARRRMFAVLAPDAWNNTWWADPVCLGHYPDDALRLFGDDAPAHSAADMDLIRQPLDFYGVNIYTGDPCRPGPDGNAHHVPWPDGNPLTTFRWNIAPESLYWGPRFIHERYGLPIYITENGLANADWVAADGRVHDPQRIDFTRAYLLQLARAADEGVDIRGYFHWSIMDNFEWAEGFRERFGLVHVDYQSLARTPKDSAYWYRDVIASNGASLASTIPTVHTSLRRTAEAPA